MRGYILSLFILFLTACVPEYNYHTPPKLYAGPSYTPALQASWHTDIIPQVPAFDANFIFVIDNSCSMDNDQLKIAQNMPPMIEILHEANVDYRIAITNTDTMGSIGGVYWYQGKPWIDRNSISPVETFSSAVIVGVGGGFERGIFSTYQVLTTGVLPELGFYRYASPLHIFIASDEPDQTANPGDLTPDEFWSALNYHQAISGDVQIHTIANFPNGKACQLPYADPSRYVTLSKDTGGTVMELCADDWTHPIDRIVDDVLEQKIRYNLSRFPVEDTIGVTVEINGSTLVFQSEVDWTYDSTDNSVVFHDFIPEEGSVFVAEYMLATTKE